MVNRQPAADGKSNIPTHRSTKEAIAPCKCPDLPPNSKGGHWVSAGNYGTAQYIINLEKCAGVGRRAILSGVIGRLTLPVLIRITGTSKIPTNTRVLPLEYQ